VQKSHTSQANCSAFQVSKTTFWPLNAKFCPFCRACRIGFLAGLTFYYGFESVMAAVVSSRWATALVVVARAVALAGAGIGWWALVPARQRGPSAFVLLRFVREAINSFFPFAVIGGDVIGARLLARFGVVTSLAAGFDPKQIILPFRTKRMGR
jgi:hypothetical protein